MLNLYFNMKPYEKTVSLECFAKDSKKKYQLDTTVCPNPNDEKKKFP